MTRAIISLVIFFCWAACFVGAAKLANEYDENQAKQSAIVFCIEQPKQCKIEYDYYKLQNKK